MSQATMSHRNKFVGLNVKQPRCCGRWMMAFSLSLLFVLGAAAGSFGHETEDKYKGYVAGRVTVVHEKGIRINNKDYRMASGVAVYDQYKRVVDPRLLSQGDNIYFHLDSDGIIDAVIVIIPS